VEIGVRALEDLLADLKRRGVRLRLNQGTGRLEYQGELDADLRDELRRRRREFEAHLWALQRQRQRQHGPGRGSSRG
jgi:hypothetical protein